MNAGVSTHQGIRIAAAPGLGGAFIDQSFQIVRVTHTPNQVVVTWNSKPNKTYTVFRSGNLFESEEVTDGLESGGSTTTFTIDLTDPPESQLYVWVLEED